MVGILGLLKILWHLLYAQNFSSYVEKKISIDLEACLQVEVQDSWHDVWLSTSKYGFSPGLFRWYCCCEKKQPLIQSSISNTCVWMSVGVEEQKWRSFKHSHSYPKIEYNIQWGQTFRIWGPVSCLSQNHSCSSQMFLFIHFDFDGFCPLSFGFFCLSVIFHRLLWLLRVKSTRTLKLCSLPDWEPATNSDSFPLSTCPWITLPFMSLSFLHKLFSLPGHNVLHPRLLQGFTWRTKFSHLQDASSHLYLVTWSLIVLARMLVLLIFLQETTFCGKNTYENENTAIKQSF